MNRVLARENAFLLIFEGISKADEVAEEIFTKAVEYRELECDNYVKNVFFGANENKKIITEELDKHTVGWNKNRISKVSYAILTLAAYEIMFMPDIPGKVSINEAVNLAKKYDDDKAYSFVNGVLNSLVKAVRENG
ncbi:MAG: transcription antitermination factor NusB [Clostridia bacterium]|nr:transcription antitermination factor NusB [Clostridia bacterium]